MLFLRNGVIRMIQIELVEYRYSRATIRNSKTIATSKQQHLTVRWAGGDIDISFSQ